jgi:hypothetical protein
MHVYGAQGEGVLEQPILVIRAPMHKGINTIIGMSKTHPGILR